MNIIIIISAIGVLTYYFFRSNKNKDKMKKTELSDIDKEELTKIEKIVGKRIPYTFANEKGLEFQIIEFIRPGYIKRRIFDHRGHCHYLIKYNLDRSIVEFIEFGIKDGNFYRKTVFDSDKVKEEFYQNNKRRVANIAQIKTNFSYYKSIINEVRAIIMPIEADLKQYAKELENHAYYQKEWVSRNKVTNSQEVSSITKVEKIDFAKKRDLRKALNSNNITRIKAINSSFKTYNLLVENFQKRLAMLQLDDVKYLHSMDILSNKDLLNISNLLSGTAAEALVNKKIREVQAGKELMYNLVLPYPYNKKDSLDSNQIDHLVIATSGIFCLETKARTIKQGEYDTSEDYNDVADQVSKHKESIKYVLEKSHNPVIIQLLKRVPIDKLIRNVVVFVSRTDDNFELKKIDRYTKMDIEVIQLSDLQALMVRAKDKISLQSEEIEALREELANNNSLEEEKAFKKNVLLFSEGNDLDEQKVNEQLYHANQIIKHIERINGLLDKYLTDARKWKKQYQNYRYWRKFYQEVSTFTSSKTYFKSHQEHKNILDKI